MNFLIHVTLALLQVLFKREGRSLISVLHFPHDLVIGAHYAAFFMVDGVEMVLLSQIRHSVDLVCDASRFDFLRHLLG